MATTVFDGTLTLEELRRIRKEMRSSITCYYTYNHNPTDYEYSFSKQEGPVSVYDDEEVL